MAIKKYGPGGPSGTNYSMFKEKKDGSVKNYKPISESRFNRMSKRYAKQDGSHTLGTDTSVKQQFISGKNPRNSVSRNTPDDIYEMKTGGSTKWTRRKNDNYKKFN